LHIYIHIHNADLDSTERNLSLSLAAGNATIWKPSPTTPLCAVATTKIISKVLERNGVDPAAAGLVCGREDVGKAVVASPLVDMGKSIII
jgi:aldehyde dehydrogenase family 7 protein A1